MRKAPKKPSRKTRLKAVRAIARMRLPVADWQTMEREIVQGALGKRKR